MTKLMHKYMPCIMVMTKLIHKTWSLTDVILFFLTYYHPNHTLNDMRIVEIISLSLLERAHF